MRFRRKVRICKGVSLNLSGSGISASVGVRGASITVGKNGTYANYGIPGTGLYDRKKISSKPTQSPYHSSSLSTQAQFRISVDLDEKGAPLVTVLDSNNREVTDDYIINKIKRDPRYKESVLSLSQEKKAEIEAKSKHFINVFKSTEKPIIDSHPLEVKLRSLKLQTYNRSKFSILQPSIEAIRCGLEEESQVKVSSIFFWTKKLKREKYVADNLDSRYTNAIQKWELSRVSFEEEQDKKEIIKNKQYLEVYNSRKYQLEGFLNLNEEYIDATINSILGKMVLPVDFSIDYEIDIEHGLIKIDLDLPEIEDIPSQKVNELASGKISIKSKSIKEINQDYAICVCGLAYYFAGLFFNISYGIKNIQIAGYTQRIDTKDGKIKDDYIYAVAFDRLSFANIEYSSIDPVESLQSFPHIINITKTFIFKSIDPDRL